MAEFDLAASLASLAAEEDLPVVENSEETKKNVAVYIRTSTKKQSTSIKNQQTIADLYIKNRNKDFKDAETEEKEIIKDIKEDVSIYRTYTDQYSGKSSKGRTEFEEMMRDAELGCFQTVYTKSISRFCRNLEDGLRLTRELKELGVNVYFQEENIDSMNPNHEFIFVILAKVAEQELTNTSAHLREMTKAKRANNELVNPVQCYGYGWIPKYENRNLKDEERAYIIPEQAEIIKKVYKMFLDEGMSISDIARKLTADKVITKTGGTGWTYKKVRSILVNEKYTGYSYKQKFFSKDYKSKRVELDIITKKNKKYGFDDDIVFYRNEDGSLKQTQPRIIEPQDYFLSVRKLIDIANANVKPEKVYHTFTGKIMCGSCGNYFTRSGGYIRDFKERGKYEIKARWLCKSYRKKGNNTLMSVNDAPIGCPESITIREDYLQELFIKILQDLTEHKQKVMIKAQIDNFKAVLSKQSKDDEELAEQIATAEHNMTLNKYLIIKIEDGLDFYTEDIEIMRSLDYADTFIRHFESMLMALNQKTNKLIDVDDIENEIDKRDNMRKEAYQKYIKGFYAIQDELFIKCDMLKARKYDEINIRENITALEEITKIKHDDIKEWNDSYAKLFRRIVEYVQVGEYVAIDADNAKDVKVVFVPNNIIFKLKWNANSNLHFKTNKEGRKPDAEKEFRPGSSSAMRSRKNGISYG